MPDHLLLSTEWAWKSTVTELQGEIGVNTLRHALVRGNIDDVGTFPDFNADPATESDSGANYVAEGNFNVNQDGFTFSPIDFLQQQAQVAWMTFLATNVRMANRWYIKRLALYPIGSDGKVKDIAGQPGVMAKCQIDYQEGFGLHGSSTADLLPPDVAACLSWNTLLSSRRGRGRNYLGGLVNGILANGLFTNAFQTGMATDGAQMIADMQFAQAGGGWQGKPVVTGSPWTNYGVIKSVRVGRNPDTQRRRTAQISEDYEVVAVP